MPREPVLSRMKERYFENRELDAGAPWKEWLWHRYARYWYGIGCLFLDVVVLGTVLQSGPAPDWWQYLLAVALVIGLGFVEFKGYGRLWPRPPLEP